MIIKGYYTGAIYWGWIEEEQRYMAFPTEREYLDYISDEEGDD